LEELSLQTTLFLVFAKEVYPKVTPGLPGEGLIEAALIDKKGFGYFIEPLETAKSALSQKRKKKQSG